MYCQVRHVLLFLILALFGIASLGYSQDTDEKPSEEPNPVEQSTEEPDPLVTQFKDLETQLNSLKSRFDNSEIRLNTLEDASGNPFQTIAMICIVLFILTFVFAIFLGLKIGRQQKKLNEITQEWQGFQEKLNENSQMLQTSLDYVQQIDRDNTDKLEKVESKQSAIKSQQATLQKVITETRIRIDNIDLTLANLETRREEESIIEYQQEAGAIVQRARERVAELVRAYRAGEPIDFIEIETPTPSQKVHLIARYLHQWKNELAQSARSDSYLVQILTSAEEVIKDQLKAIRGEVPPSPKSLDLETNISTDIELNEIRDQCIDYVARFEGTLSGYELGHEVDEATYAEFIPQFIKNQLFNNVARFIPLDLLPEELDRFLQLADYEVIFIEIGKTKANARVHVIQGSQQSDVEPGTIAEVITPGLRRKTDNTTAQKPVVIRGE